MLGLGRGYSEVSMNSELKVVLQRREGVEWHVGDKKSLISWVGGGY